MDSIIDDLEEDHRRFRRYLVWLTEEIDALARGERPDYFFLNMLSEYFAHYPDELHHRKEDIVYARLASHPRHRETGLIDLHEEHCMLSERASQFCEQVQLILNDEQLPIARITKYAREYKDLLGRHMMSEDALLFKPARKLFSRSDWENVNDAIGDLYAEEINFDKARKVLDLEASIDAYAKRKKTVLS